VSSTAVLDRPTDESRVELDWVVLHDPTPPSRVQTIGRGVERRGRISRGSIKTPARNLVALPAVDDLTS
jgi:hypothetical protein